MNFKKNENAGEIASQILENRPPTTMHNTGDSKISKSEDGFYDYLTQKGFTRADINGLSIDEIDILREMFYKDMK